MMSHVTDRHETTDRHERGPNFITADEHKQLLIGAGRLRHPERNRLLIMLLYRHGLRESEAVGLYLRDLNLARARLWVRRLKNGLSTEHPIADDELRLLRRYLRVRDSSLPWLFINGQQGQLSRHSVIYVLQQAAEQGGIARRITPHMLRHGCGYYLANRGHDLRVIQDYLGHRDPRHTARYTRTAAHRFQNLWADAA